MTNDNVPSVIGINYSAEDDFAEPSPFPCLQRERMSSRPLFVAIAPRVLRPFVHVRYREVAEILPQYVERQKGSLYRFRCVTEVVQKRSERLKFRRHHGRIPEVHCIFRVWAIPSDVIRGVSILDLLQCPPKAGRNLRHYGKERNGRRHASSLCFDSSLPLICSCQRNCRNDSHQRSNRLHPSGPFGACHA